MMSPFIGLVANSSDVPATVQLIQRADALGIPAAWLIQAGVGPASLPTFAAAAMQARQIIFGTAIIPIWPRHPLALAQEVVTVYGLAPERIRLGLGPSAPGAVQAYGIEYGHPLGHLREYIAILRTLFTQGQVDFDGQYYKAHGRLGAPNQPPPHLNVPILASALRRGSFEFCGEATDGALSWVCPMDYLKNVALPALTEGARKGGRATPPLIAHVPMVIDTNIDQVRAAVRSVLAVYPRLPHYQKMFTAAGFPEVMEGQWSDRMIEAVVVHGDRETVARRIEEIRKMGISEIMAHPVPSAPDRAASLAQILETVAEIARQGAAS